MQAVAAVAHTVAEHVTAGQKRTRDVFRQLGNPGSATGDGVDAEGSTVGTTVTLQLRAQHGGWPPGALGAAQPCAPKLRHRAGQASAAAARASSAPDSRRECTMEVQSLLGSGTFSNVSA